MKFKEMWWFKDGWGFGKEGCNLKAEGWDGVGLGKEGWDG